MKKPAIDPKFPAIVIDSREQRPLPFPKSYQTIIKGLHTGDYSLLGYENRIAVERKSKSDSYASLGSNRERFEKELIRLGDMEYGAIVIECSLREFLLQPDYSKMHPHAAINSLVAWSIKYGVPVFLGDDRRHSAALVLSILRHWWKYFGEGNGQNEDAADGTNIGASNERS